jgi:hypothetical protein
MTVFAWNSDSKPYFVIELICYGYFCFLIQQKLDSIYLNDIIYISFLNLIPKKVKLTSKKMALTLLMLNSYGQLRRYIGNKIQRRNA